MKIIHILPEFEEGGVERHVLWLANEQAAGGHSVTVVSGGGKLERELQGVGKINLPVHLKNPITALYSSVALAKTVKKEKVNIIHAHSRVPAWIAWWTSRLSGVPWIATCHGFYSKKVGLLPYGKAKALICVSEAVGLFFSEVFPGAYHNIIYNGLPDTSFSWRGSVSGEVNFLYVGRLTRKKGILTLIEAFSRVSSRDWTLDILGDGPLYDHVKTMVFTYGLEDKVKLHGFCDIPEEWMAKCGCFLFPSLEEGMGLTLMRAVKMGVPVIASDLPAVREISLSHSALLGPGDVQAWVRAIDVFLTTGAGTSLFDPQKIPAIKEMAENVEHVYRDILERNQ